MKCARYIFALATLLAACTDPVAQLATYDPQSVDFASALAGEYLQYAEAEKEQKHYGVAKHFGARGLTATQGWEIDPEAVPANAADAEKSALIAARVRLLQALNKKAREVEILKAARAQMMFDCWAYGAGNGLKEEGATCRDAYYSAIAELEHAVGLRPPQKTVTSSLRGAVRDEAIHDATSQTTRGLYNDQST